LRWLRVAIDDVALALSAVVRPWTDLRAVKTTQVDLVKTIAGQQHDVATVQASVNALSEEVARLKACEAEQEATIRQLRSTVDVLQRELNRGSPQAADPRARLR
jgi:uncharacterized protein YlxW (UPF0749 family)